MLVVCALGAGHLEKALAWRPAARGVGFGRGTWCSAGLSEPAFSFYLGRNSVNALNLKTLLCAQPVLRATKNGRPVSTKFLSYNQRV